MRFSEVTAPGVKRGGGQKDHMGKWFMWVVIINGSERMYARSSLWWYAAYLLSPEGNESFTSTRITLFSWLKKKTTVANWWQRRILDKRDQPGNPSTPRNWCFVFGVRTWLEDLERGRRRRKVSECRVVWSEINTHKTWSL